jgi:hypothetical protein
MPTRGVSVTISLGSVDLALERTGGSQLHLLRVRERSDRGSECCVSGACSVGCTTDRTVPRGCRTYRDLGVPLCRGRARRSLCSRSRRLVLPFGAIKTQCPSPCLAFLLIIVGQRVSNSFKRLQPVSALAASPSSAAWSDRSSVRATAYSCLPWALLLIVSSRAAIRAAPASGPRSRMPNPLVLRVCCRAPRLGRLATGRRAAPAGSGDTHRRPPTKASQAPLICRPDSAHGLAPPSHLLQPLVNDKLRPRTSRREIHPMNPRWILTRSLRPSK